MKKIISTQDFLRDMTDIEIEARDLTENMESKITELGSIIHSVNYDPSDITKDQLRSLKRIDALLDKAILITQ